MLCYRDEMSEPFVTPGWDFEGVEHGFAPQETAVAEHLRLVRVTQVHGRELVVARADTASPAGEADGLLTAAPGLAVAVATADCVPVLLVAPDARAVAAVHAGWRGSLAGIVARAVVGFSEHFGAPATAIRAALGPSIDGCCYEIEREIAQRFVDQHGLEMWSAWKDGTPGKGTLDLRSVNELLLERAGVPEESIQRVGPCTACGDADLASYRVDGPGGGRQLSWIGISA